MASTPPGNGRPAQLAPIVGSPALDAAVVLQQVMIPPCRSSPASGGGSSTRVNMALCACCEQALGELEQVKKQLRQPGSRSAVEASISRLEHGLAMKSNVCLHAELHGVLVADSAGAVVGCMWCLSTPPAAHVQGAPMRKALRATLKRSRG